MRAKLSTGALVLLLAACGGEEAEPVDELDPPATGVLEAPAADAGAQAEGAVVNVAQHPELGAYLTDAGGRALYLLEADTGRTSTCYDACAQEWPPYLAQGGTPVAGDPAVQAGMLGTIQRRDGSTQVVYGDWPLYYYHDDRGPGQTQGQDVTDQWGEWYLVAPSGQPLEGHHGGSGS